MTRGQQAHEAEAKRPSKSLLRTLLDVDPGGSAGDGRRRRSRSRRRRSRSRARRSRSRSRKSAQEVGGRGARGSGETCQDMVEKWLERTRDLSEVRDSRPVRDRSRSKVRLRSASWQSTKTVDLDARSRRSQQEKTRVAGASKGGSTASRRDTT